MTDAPKIETQAPDTSRDAAEAVLKRAQITSGMLKMGERIAWGSDSGAIDDLSDLCEAILAERDLADARAAAAWIDGRDAAWQTVAGYIDPQSGHDDALLCDMRDEIEDITPPADPAAALDRLIAERVQDAVEAERARIADEITQRRMLLHQQLEVLDISREDAVYKICVEVVRGSKEGRDG